MTIHLTFPRINPLQDVEVTLAGSVDTVRTRPASREQCNCDCACNFVGSTAGQVALSLPTAFYLELTSWCPNRCVGCGNVFIDRKVRRRNQAELGWEDWRIVLEKIVPSATMVKLTGGEPTQSPHFYRIVDFLEDRQIPFAVLTSGLWPNPRKLLATLGARTQFQGFLISLHGSTPQRHELFTQNAGSYQTALRAIRLSTEAGMDVSVSTILLRSNMGQLKEVADVALAQGAKNIIFARQIGEPVPPITLDDSELIQSMEEVAALQYQGYPVKIGNCVPQCFHPNPSSGCTAGLTFCTIDPTGNLRPCNHSRVLAGSLLDQSLEELWNSRELLDWRAMLSPTCSACPSQARCGGGCKVMYEHGMDPLMTVPENANLDVKLPKVQATLFKHSIPTARYIHIMDNPGNMILGKGLAIPVDHDVEEFLRETIGRKTLEEIQDTYGSPALSFIANLHTLGLVELSQLH
jgi:AdoMet-dependent heme synthase